METLTLLNPELPGDWFTSVRGCVLDMDGVIYRGDTLIPEARTLLETLDAAGIAWSMATNNSTASPAEYVAKLARMGIAAPEARIVTSSVATGTWLRSHYPAGTRVYVVGMAALERAIFGDGYFLRAERDAEVVVSGAHFELRYEYLKIACLAIRAGASYVATNADRTFPSEEGLIPGSGAVVAAISAATDREPVVIGKPSPAMVESCMTIMGTDPASTLMIGDRLDTDILGGQRAGARTALVLTGVSTREEVAATGIAPDIVVETLTPLTALARERAAGVAR